MRGWCFSLGSIASATLGLVTVAAAAEVRLKIAGADELAVSADQMNCSTKDFGHRHIDVADMPPTAFRRADGTVVMLAGNRTNYYFEGRNLDSVGRTGCKPLLKRNPKEEPKAFQDNEWLFALYAKRNDFVLGFVHNEYHGEEHNQPGCTFRQSVREASTAEEKRHLRAYRSCWYAASTLVLSTDGGHSFERPKPPMNVLASLPYKFSPSVERAGVHSPKVIGHRGNGMLYVFTTMLDRGRQKAIGQCVLRGSGSAIDDWQIWNGSRFTKSPGSPYRKNFKIGTPYCKPVLASNVMSIKYLPRYKLYVALAVERLKVVYRFSSDLINWGPARQLMKARPFGWWRPGKPGPKWYFSLLDPESSSRNFDTLERRPYIYYVKARTKGNKLLNRRRDIFRVPIKLVSP